MMPACPAQVCASGHPLHLFLLAGTLTFKISGFSTLHGRSSA